VLVHSIYIPIKSHSATKQLSKQKEYKGHSMCCIKSTHLQLQIHIKTKVNGHRKARYATTLTSLWQSDEVDAENAFRHFSKYDMVMTSGRTESSQYIV